MKKSFEKLSIAASAAFLLMGCPGGGSNNNQPTPVLNVNQNGIIAYFPNETCNIQVNSYTCTQNIANLTYNTPSIPFNTPQEMCAKLADNASATINMDRMQLVALQTRNRLISERCAGIVPIVPQNPVTLTNGMKNFTCRIDARIGEVESGTQTLQFVLPATGAPMPITAVGFQTIHKKILGIPSYARILKKIATVSVQYIPGTVGLLGTQDEIKMSVRNLDGEVSALMTGFAGAENTLKIVNDDAADTRTQLTISCTSSDAKIMVPQVALTKYICQGIETRNGKKESIKFESSMNEFLAGESELSDVLSARAEGTPAPNAGLVEIAQSNPKQYEDSAVHVSADLSAKTTVSIVKPDYALKLACKPK